MSFEEKLVKIAENEQKVFEAGQKSMVDESKIIEKTAIGTTTLTIDDVSEIPHDVEVQLGGYNLFKGETIREKYYLNAETNGLNSFKVFGTNGIGTPKYVRYEFDAIPNTNMVISCDWSSINANDSLQRIGVFNSVSGLKFIKWSSGKYGDLDNEHFVCNFNTGDATKIAILFYCENPNYGTILPNYEASVINIQLIEGTTDLPFMPYDADFSGISLSVNGETYSSTATGLFQGIKSVSPNMTFTTDEGLKIEARYHKSWGMQTEWDREWDSRQENGNRTNYNGEFAGSGWTPYTFRPKHDIRPTSALYMFYNATGLAGLDMVERFNEQNIVFDTSKIADFYYAFKMCYAKRWGVIDTTGAKRLTSMLSEGYGYLETVDKIILKNDGSQIVSGMLQYCTALVNITIEGVIGQNGLDLQKSTKLSKASIISFFNAASTTASITITFSKVAVNKAFETSSGANNGSTSDEWLNLLATKPNVTVSLV
jgi:hypothetical protein